MNVQSVSQLFQPRLEVTPDPKVGYRLVNTTGDTLDQDYSAIIPKAQATFGKDEDGVLNIKVSHGQQEQWVPAEAFEETPGEHGVYYLPTFKDSTQNAVLSGALRGYAALGIFGVASGAAGGLTELIPTHNKAIKLGSAALAGAAITVAGQALFQGNTALPLAALLGGISGVGASLAGSGEARVRDCLYGGAAAGIAVTIVTGSPLMGMLTGGTAAGLASFANHKTGQAITGGAIGAALGATQALLTQSNIGMAAGIGAAVGAIGPLIGPPLMQLSRNLAQMGGEKIRDFASGRSDNELVALSAIPGALSFGLLGGAAGILDPRLALPGMALGAVLGGAKGMYSAHKRIEQLKAAETPAAQPKAEPKA